MKYENYNIEDLVFLKKETEKWSINEKREFLETCPENSKLKDTLEQLKEIKQALEDGTIKQNRYHEINKNSMKAFLAIRDTNILYGQPSSRYYYTDSKDFYFMADGDYEYISRSYSIDSLIEKYTSEEHLEHRFDALSRKYYNGEKNWAKRIEEESYTALHADRIEANKKLDSVLHAFRIELPASVQTSAWGNISCETKRMFMQDFPYSHNNYGEITVNNAPFSEGQATELMNIILEMSARISDIIDEYKGVVGTALGRKEN